MEVVVDGQGGRQTLPPGARFRDVFDAVRREAVVRRRVVVSMALDGEPLPPERQSALREEVPSDRARLEATTLGPSRVAETLERAHEEAAALLASGDYTKALEKLNACFQDWVFLVGAVRDICALSSTALGALQAGGTTIDAHVRKLMGALARLRDALKQGDAVLLGDIAQHELKPLAGEWRAVLEALLAHAAAVLGPAP